MTLIELKNQIEKLLKDEPENANKQLVLWDSEYGKWYPVTEVELIEIGSERIEITVYD